MTSSTLKSLQTQISSLQAKANSLTTHKSQLDKELSDINKKISILNNQLSLLTKDFVVSEHALLRFLERTLDLDLKAISTSILAVPNLDATYNTLGNGTYKHPSGLSLVIKDKVIITCK